MNLKELKHELSQTTRNQMGKIYETIKTTAMGGEEYFDFSTSELSTLEIKVLEEDGYTVDYDKYTQIHRVSGW